MTVTKSLQPLEQIMKREQLIITTSVAFLVAACGQQAQISGKSSPEPIKPSEVLIESEQDLSALTAPVQKAKQATVLSDHVAQQERQRFESKRHLPPLLSTVGIHHQPGVVERENYAHFEDNGVKLVSQSPVSTFSIDVDTGSYSNVRRILKEGRLPPADAVRVEEMINYFSYGDPVPEQSDIPFRMTTEMGPAPWNSRTNLLRIGIKAWQQSTEELPPVNLVFLVDVSGSMNSPDKLELLKKSFRLLLPKLDGQDRVSLVVYAGASGVVLEPTSGDQRAKIEQALNRLSAGGSTNGGAGIELAYAKARESFIQGGVNRVILATDGDFNVGTVNHESLINLIERMRDGGIGLTTLGFGRGNYNDRLMEQLADHGNGNYAYIDSLIEARKVLVEEMGSTLYTVAKDVKIQLEFNPAVVSEYRLIGYENRTLAREDFNNDKVDAGEIGSGHSVTALYEIALKDSGGERVMPLRYGRKTHANEVSSPELGHLRLRYKRPDGQQSRLIERVLHKQEIQGEMAATSDDFRFTAAIAGFGQLLRGGRYLQSYDYDRLIELARGSRGLDSRGHRNGLLQLLSLARDLNQNRLNATGQHTPVDRDRG
jgi:Ca-activated chloride channel family protein